MAFQLEAATVRKLLPYQTRLEKVRQCRTKKCDSVAPIQDTGSDNPPVGILLCTRKGKKMVEYALAGMDNRLFVTTYMLQLPDRKTLEEFLLQQLPE